MSLRSGTTNLRRIDTLADIQNSSITHCRGHLPNNGNNDTRQGNYFQITEEHSNRTHLIPYGGGRGPGRLWNDYYRMHERKKAPQLKGEKYSQHTPVERAIFKLLRPSEAINLALHTAISDAMNRTSPLRNSSMPRKIRLLALHPRVEQDMLTHRCSRNMNMEPNVTKIFERIEMFHEFRDNSSAMTFDLVFLAVSKSQIEKKPNRGVSRPLFDIMVDNLRVLTDVRQNGLFGRIPVFESGIDTAKIVRFHNQNLEDNVTLYNMIPPSLTAESLGVVELVASVINFFTAVIADFFIGVRGSSFSTDVFSLRYYLSKNNNDENIFAKNFIIGLDGIKELLGLPEIHDCSNEQ